MPRRLHQDQTRAVAREISYASSAASRGGRAMIRVMENATGRIGLIRRVEGYDAEVREGRDFWQVMVERYGLELKVIGGSLDLIPREGPLILIANHPYGILDGLMMGHILSMVRGDFRILAHRVFRKAEDINRIILPISFEDTKEALALNLDTRKTALRYLSEGGAIGIFPGGTVSTAARPFGRPMDPGWRSFTARMIAKSDATVVPMFFDGHNSRLFQLMSHLHTTLRMGLLIKEFRARVNSPVEVAIGQAIPRTALDPFARDAKAMMEFLRETTYGLSPRSLDGRARGFEFEDRHRDPDAPRRGDDPSPAGPPVEAGEEPRDEGRVEDDPDPVRLRPVRQPRRAGAVRHAVHPVDLVAAGQGDRQEGEREEREEESRGHEPGGEGPVSGDPPGGGGQERASSERHDPRQRAPAQEGGGASEGVLRSGVGGRRLAETGIEDLGGCLSDPGNRSPRNENEDRRDRRHGRHGEHGPIGVPRRVRQPHPAPPSPPVIRTNRTGRRRSDRNRPLARRQRWIAWSRPGPTGATSRPPSASCSKRDSGTEEGAAVRTIPSKPPGPGHPSRPSAAAMRAFPYPSRRSVRAARIARSGTISTDRTSRTISASTAVW